MATLAAVLVATLMGSLHCASMCGPLVAFALGTTETLSHRARAALQLAYHGGRLVTYAAIGGVCGLVGAALDLTGALVGLKSVAAILAGAMMVGVGVAALLRYSGVRLPQVPVPRWVTRGIQLGQRAAAGLRPLPRALTIGLLTGLLPCGFLYMFAVVAAGTGSVAAGAAVMAAFWLGTIPVLASLGVGVQALTGKLGRRVPLMTAMAIVLLGLFTIGERVLVPAGAFAAHGKPAAGTDPIRQVEAIPDTLPPCCRDRAGGK